MDTTNHSPQPIRDAHPTHHLRHGVLNLLLVLLWLWLFRPALAYLHIIFTQEDFRTNQLVLLGILLLLVSQFYRRRWRPRPWALPQWRPGPLALLLTTAVLFLLAERYLAINMLTAVLFGLSGYALLGLWLPPTTWRAGLPAALLLIGALPFGAHLQTFVGYPLRLATAALVRDGLHLAGFGSVGVDTILVFENGISKIDLPCSGIQSLWTGLLFLLAATWLEQKRLGWRWGLTSIWLIFLLILTNLLRVAILVTVGEVLGWRLLAEMLHVPLGVLGFVVACAAALYGLRTFVPTWTQPPPPPAALNRRPVWLSLLLAGTLVGLSMLYAPRPATGLSGSPQSFAFPADLLLTPEPLKPDEQAWLEKDGADTAVRYRFDWRGHTGSMILITSRTWRAHHRPERCFEVYGLTLHDSRPHLVTPTQPVRYVLLGDTAAEPRVSAAYWFQSTTQTTDDYATRIWADVQPQRETWVLVSILFDTHLPAHHPDAEALYTALHTTVDTGLKNEG